MKTEKNGSYTRSSHYADQWMKVEPRKADVRIGDLVFTEHGDCGIVADTDYNDADEVEVDWITTENRRAARTSIVYLTRVIRLLRIGELEAGLASIGARVNELIKVLTPGE